MKRNQGLTAIEILVTITILSIITATITVALLKLNSYKVLDKEVSLVVSILDEARSLTLSAKNNSEYGVHLEASQVVLFEGGSYSSSDPSNVITTVDGRVGIRNISLSGGGVDVIFNRLTGETDESGSVELFLVASSTVYRTINITPTGIINMSN